MGTTLAIVVIGVAAPWFRWGLIRAPNCGRHQSSGACGLWWQCTGARYAYIVYAALIEITQHELHGVLNNLYYNKMQNC